MIEDPEPYQVLRGPQHHDWRPGAACPAGLAGVAVGDG